MFIPKQENRLMKISNFGLGDDALVVVAFSGAEYVNRPYEFRLDLVSPRLWIKPDEVIGKSVTVKIHDDNQRLFTGIVASVTLGEINARRLRDYRIVLKPRFALMDKNQNCRIFQNKTTQEIVTSLLHENGYRDATFNLLTQNRREYCVQFNESDFHFISRLLEEDGISYFFEHERDKHRLILFDRNAAFAASTQELYYSHGTSTKAQIHQWRRVQTLHTNVFTLQDYLYQQPQKNLETTVKSEGDAADGAHLEHYEYSGVNGGLDYNHILQRRLEAEEAKAVLIEGTSNFSGMRAGQAFQLMNPEGRPERDRYIPVKVVHDIKEAVPVAGATASIRYTNNFICVSQDTPVKPCATHKKAVMPGPQNALVVGPAGEDVYTDALGRIKVHFFWDRGGPKNETSSCFVRVVQAVSGNKWGVQFTPRVGQEVIVGFINGDPERPIVLGSVFNERNRPPFGSKFQSGLRTRSTKHGQGQKYNELMFDDKYGQELVYLKAEKNLSLRVNSNAFYEIDGDRSATVGADDRLEIGENQRLKVGGNRTVHIEGDCVSEIQGAQSQTCSKSIEMTAAKTLHCKAERLVLEASKTLVIQAGAAKITLQQSGEISICGTSVTINGAGGVSLKGITGLSV